MRISLSNLGLCNFIRGGTPAAASGTLDLRYNAATSQREIQNAGDFPGATFVFLAEDATTVVATTTDTFLADAVTDQGTYVQVQGQPETRSLLCFKGREYIDNLNIDLADVADDTTVASLGFVADAGFTVSGGKIVAPSKITTFIERRIHGTPGDALGTAASPLNMEIEATVENYDLGGAADGTYKSARTLFADYSSSTQRVYTEQRGNIASLWKRASSGYHQFGSNNTTGVPNATTLLLRVHHIDGVKYVTARRKVPGGAFERFIAVDTGPGQAVNGPGTAIPNGNSVALIGVNNLYSGSDYPLSLYQGEVKTRSWAPTAINIYETDFNPPTIEDPVTITVVGHTEHDGELHVAWVLDQYKRAVSEAFTFTPSTNEINVDIPLIGENPLFVRIALASDPSVSTTEEILTIETFRPIEENFRLGINTGSIGAAYPLIFNDASNRIRWAYGTSAGGLMSTTDYPVPLGENKHPLGIITDEAYAAGARCLMPMLSEGRDIFPYGTGGTWTFTVEDMATDEFTFQSGFIGSNSPFSSFSMTSTGFTCTVTDNVETVAGDNSTTWVRFVVNPTVNDGKGTLHPNGMQVSFLKNGSEDTNLLLASVRDAFGRAEIVRPMQEHMTGSHSIRNISEDYPHNPSRWSNMDRFLDLVQGFNPNAVGWLCQPTYRTGTAIDEWDVDPDTSLRLTFRKMSEDLSRFHARPTYTQPLIWEPDNEIFATSVAPYGQWSYALQLIADRLGFFTSMPTGGVKEKAQRYAAACWLANIAGTFSDTGVFPDVTPYGFPDMSDLHKPDHKVPGRWLPVIGVLGNSGTYTGIPEIQSWFDEAGDVSRIWGLATTSYFFVRKAEGSWVSLLEADDYAGALADLLVVLQNDVNNLRTNAINFSQAAYAAWPDKKILTYEGRLHLKENFSTEAMSEKFRTLVYMLRAHPTYKALEKQVIMDHWNAGFWGMADFHTYERNPLESVLDKGKWTFQWFGMMSDAGKWTDPATSADQMAALAWNEMHDFKDALTP